MHALFRRIVSLSGVAVAAWAFPGCYAIIHADSPGEHCGFAGAETTCGKCLRENCQTPIDKCCADEDCLDGNYASEKGFMEVLDTCASGDPSVCSTLLQPGDFAYIAPAKILSACLADKCIAQCAGTARPHRSCKDTELGKCECTNETEKKGDACSVSSVGGGPDAICLEWVGGCTCAKMSCTGGGTSCTCTNNGESGGFTGCQRDTTSKYAHCCVEVSETSGTVRCRCDDSSCSSGDAEVEACTDAAFRAALSNRIVDKCDN